MNYGIVYRVYLDLIIVMGQNLALFFAGTVAIFLSSLYPSFNDITRELNSLRVTYIDKEIIIFYYDYKNTERIGEADLFVVPVDRLQVLVCYLLILIAVLATVVGVEYIVPTNAGNIIQSALAISFISEHFHFSVSNKTDHQALPETGFVYIGQTID